MEIKTLFTIAGIGVTVGLIEKILESMGKKNISLFIHTITISGISFYTIIKIDDLFKEMERIFII